MQLGVIPVMFESQYNDEMESEVKRLEAAKRASIVAAVVERLNLARHPEGGWYRETYRSAESIPADAVPDRFNGDRSVSTAIYFLLEKGDVSHLHRIKSDELWHFYSGAPLTLHLISQDGIYSKIVLGSGPAHGETFQAVVPAGYWFGAEVTGSGDYSLVGCTVAPGFDFADFEMGDRDELLQRYPEHAEVISLLTQGCG
jgi:predicted cupin superfamily sugar epimerase